MSYTNLDVFCGITATVTTLAAGAYSGKSPFGAVVAFGAGVVLSKMIKPVGSKVSSQLTGGLKKISQIASDCLFFFSVCYASKILTPFMQRKFSFLGNPPKELFPQDYKLPIQTVVLGAIFTAVHVFAISQKNQQKK